MAMKKKGFIICLILLAVGCSLQPKYAPRVEIKSRHQSFDLQQASGAKMAILPLRDFSDHFGFGYSATVMNTFVKEVKQKFPHLELAEAEVTAELFKSTGKEKSYDLFIDKCITDNEYCIEQNEILRLFEDSGVNYVVSLTIGTLGIPAPGSIMIYYLSAIVYNIDLGGQVVYNAFSEGEVYPDIEEGAADFLMKVMQKISREMVAKM